MAWGGENYTVSKMNNTLRWDTGAYEVNFGQNTDFEIFVDSERKISSELNGVCYIYDTWRFECLFFNFIFPTSPKMCKCGLHCIICY